MRLVFLWAFTLLYANVLSSRKLTEWVTWTLLATGFATALLALAQKYVPGFNYGSVRVVSDQGDLTTRVGGFFYDPNYLAGFLSWPCLSRSRWSYTHNRGGGPCYASVLPASSDSG